MSRYDRSRNHDRIGLVLAAAGTEDIGSLSAGLGIIAASLVIGQYLFYKFVHLPALHRSEKILETEQQRCKEEIAAERARAERLETKIDRQNAVLEDKALPALIAATTTVSQFQSLMEEMRREQLSITHKREIDEALRQNRGG